MERDRVFTKQKGVQPAQLGDELAMLNIESGEYFVINEVGKDIWEHIDGQANISQVIESLAKAYNTEIKNIEDDVIEFIQELLEAKVISEVDR